MKAPPRRRTVLMAAGIAMAAASAGAQADVVRGTIEFAEGGPIPAGVVEISVEDSAAGGTDRITPAFDVESDGKSDMLDFTLPMAAIGSPNAEIVARLERADSWLIARGSAQRDGRSPVRIILYPAAY